MKIQWLGHACFRLRGRERTIVTDPCAPSTGYTIGRPTADILTISHHHPGHDHLAPVAGSPLVIDGPGEYEVGGVFILGIPAWHDSEQGARLGRNIVYIFDLDDLRLAHLGDLAHIPSPEQAEAMSGVDILLVPVGGGNSLDGAAAAEVVSLLEPRLIVPMHYKTAVAKAPLAPLEPFFKEMGLSSGDPLPRLTINRAQLPQEAQVVVLDYRRS